MALTDALEMKMASANLNTPPVAGDRHQADRQERPSATQRSAMASGHADVPHRYGPSEGSALPELLGAFGSAVAVMALLAFGYFMQGYGSRPTGSESQTSVATLMLFTLGAGVLIGGVVLARFVSKPDNRAIAEKTIGTG